MTKGPEVWCVAGQGSSLADSKPEDGFNVVLDKVLAIDVEGPVGILLVRATTPIYVGDEKDRLSGRGHTQDQVGNIGMRLIHHDVRHREAKLIELSFQSRFSFILTELGLVDSQ